jgi:hypothetical protein
MASLSEVGLEVIRRHPLSSSLEKANPFVHPVQTDEREPLRVVGGYD